ncbi:basic leucine zipper 2-like [Panicum miliaceum]|uniref:Basic leucine zipper 2-like n=1 Tax=Panicum miliaceum TaxID=4540 RepID=A0A3L6QSJ6_PANMI|nr:basic leucine zipper 2-like [Panicum miliaceum]
MFSDDLPPPPPPQQAAPVASSSSPSDHNSIDDEKTDRGETEQAQSKSHGDAAAASGQPASVAAVDPKRVKLQCHRQLLSES